MIRLEEALRLARLALLDAEAKVTSEQKAEEGTAKGVQVASTVRARREEEEMAAEEEERRSRDDLRLCERSEREAEAQREAAERGRG